MHAHPKVWFSSVALLTLYGCAAAGADDTARKPASRTSGGGGDPYEYVPNGSGGSGAQPSKGGASAQGGGSGRASTDGASATNGLGGSSADSPGGAGSGSSLGAGGKGSSAAAGASSSADCPSLTLARTRNGTCVPRVVEFDVAKKPTSIVLGSDRRIWVDDADRDQLLQLDDSGQVIGRVSCAPGSSPRALVGGTGDAVLWYTDAGAKTLMKVTADDEEAVMELGFEASAISLGASGDFFLTEFGKAVYRARPQELSLTHWETSPTDALVVSPDNLVWFSQGSALSQLSDTAGVTDFVLSETAYASDLCVGADSALWFSDGFANQLVRVEADGILSRTINLPTGTAPRRMIVGPDGAFWFAETGTNMIGRVTLGGEITHYPLPTSGGLPHALALGPDDNIWFTALNSNKVSRLMPDPLP